jgi:hypothetical protein
MPTTAPHSAISPARSKRDVRLDLFRGLAMLIIVIAHTPANPWNDWIPARFGFSSGAEMFVFCSGFASAMAFGSIFEKRGLMLGTARVTARIWQLYWAQIALFLVVLTISLLARQATGTDYPDKLAFTWFLTDPAAALPALMSLRYIPHLFDMLPMYILILGLIPVAMLLHRLGGTALVMAASFSLWLFVQVTGFNLPARPGAEFGWFFNPLAWQFLFLTGFALSMGWLPKPALRLRPLIIASAAFVILAIPFSFWGITSLFPILHETLGLLGYHGTPTHLHALRYLHFLALAYLILSAIEPYRDRLDHWAMLRPVTMIGRQTLAVFLVSIPLSWSMGIMLDAIGREVLSVAVVNLIGLVLAAGTAYLAGWFKSEPWRKHKPASSPQEAPQDALQTPPSLKAAE